MIHLSRVRYVDLKNSLPQLYLEQVASADRDKNHLSEDLSLLLAE